MSESSTAKYELEQKQKYHSPETVQFANQIPQLAHCQKEAPAKLAQKLVSGGRQRIKCGESIAHGLKTHASYCAALQSSRRQKLLFRSTIMAQRLWLLVAKPAMKPSSLDASYNETSHQRQIRVRD